MGRKRKVKHENGFHKTYLKEGAALDRPEGNAKTIQEEYAAIEKAIAALEITLDAWVNIIASPEMAGLIGAMRAEIDQTKLDWVSIKPSDFALSQARVQALERVISELEEAPERTRQELLAKRQLKATYETEYSLILFTEEQAERGPSEPDPRADDLNASQEQLNEVNAEIARLEAETPPQTERLIELYEKQQELTRLLDEAFETVPGAISQ